MLHSLDEVMINVSLTKNMNYLEVELQKTNLIEIKCLLHIFLFYYYFFSDILIFNDILYKVWLCLIGNKQELCSNIFNYISYSRYQLEFIYPFCLLMTIILQKCGTTVLRYLIFHNGTKILVEILCRTECNTVEIMMKWEGNIYTCNSGKRPVLE